MRLALAAAVLLPCRSRRSGRSAHHPGRHRADEGRGFRGSAPRTHRRRWGVYASDTETLKALKEAGVSERVMVALVRSGRERRLPEPTPPSCAPGRGPGAGPPGGGCRAPRTSGPAGGRPGAGLRARLHFACARSPRPERHATGATGDFAPSNYLPFSPAPPVIRQGRAGPAGLLGLLAGSAARMPGIPRRGSASRRRMAKEHESGSEEVATDHAARRSRRSPICFLTSRPIFSAAGSRTAVPISRSLSRAFSRLRLRPIEIAVDVVGERRHIGDPACAALLVGALRRHADLLFLTRHLFADVLAVRRRVLDLGVQLGADEERDPGDVEPQQQHHHAADRAVGLVVAREVRDVETEPERHDTHSTVASTEPGVIQTQSCSASGAK